MVNHFNSASHFFQKLFAKQLNKYLVLAGISSILSFVKYFIFAKVLGETGFSYYSGVELYSAYGFYLSSFGIFEGVALVLPQILKRNSDTETEVIGNSFSFLLFTSLLVALIIAILCVNYFKLPIKLIITACLYLVTFNLFSFSIMLVNTLGFPILYGTLTFYKNLYSVTISLLFGWFLGIFGLLISEIFGFALLIGLVIKKPIFNLRLRINLKVNFKRILEICRIGFPQLLNNILNNAFRNVERIVIVSFIGIAAFGNYSFASIIITIGIAIQGILNQFLFPKLAAASDDIILIKDFLKKIDQLLIISTVCLFLLYPFFILVTNYLEKNFFQEFANGILIMKILYFGMVAQFLMLYQPFYFVLRKHSLINLLTLISLLLSTLFCFAIFYFKLTIEYFAVFFVINRTIFTLILRYKLSRIINFQL